MAGAVAKLLWASAGALSCAAFWCGAAIFRGAHRRGAYDPVSRVCAELNQAGFLRVQAQRVLVNEVSERYVGICERSRKTPAFLRLLGGRPHNTAAT